MLPKAEAAYFAIADISGYTNFLAAVELDHAQDIIADFMDTVVKALRPPFRLAKFEGDAAFVYTTSSPLRASASAHLETLRARRHWRSTELACLSRAPRKAQARLRGSLAPLARLDGSARLRLWAFHGLCCAKTAIRPALVSKDHDRPKAASDRRRHREATEA
jgi:hypothetical protein